MELSNPISIIIFAIIAVYSFVLHEIAHGLMAERLGDPTPRDQGRISLNPIVHIDPIMTVIVPVFLFLATHGQFVFGAAKGVPINPSRFRDQSTALMKIAIVGPMTNLILAVALLLVLKYAPLNPHAAIAILHGYFLNVVLFVFNLLPIPPLYGSRVLRRFLPYEQAAFLDRIEPYGFIILVVLINIPPFQDVLGRIEMFFVELLAILV